MKLGARMLKTGLAVALALYAASLLNFPSNVFAGFAAVFAVQPSIYQSFKTIINQLQANIIGVSLATLMAYSFGTDPFVVGFTVTVIIGICLYLKMERSTVSIALIAVISVMETTQMEVYQFALLRFSSLMLGIFSAFIVNLLFLPPKYETTLFQHIEQTTGEILQWLRVTTRHMSDDPSLKKEINQIQKDVRRMDEIYLLFSQERVYLQKNRLPKTRKLVVFRQLTLTSRKSFFVLKAIQRVDNRTALIPDELQSLLVKEIDQLIHAHEQLLLGYMRRIKRKNKDPIEYISEPAIINLVGSLIELYQSNESEHYIFLSVATALSEYHHELIHLQTLLHSYEKYYNNEKLEILPKRER
ncbi:FUSC family protein [Natronobacillus azotifigens]|uniref:Aromatic acid exporter family protein n=1 Tax=Natronobacillus azotifigens TaxID=472978 RepID=A0A9J6RBF8_9BACI|nr:aromatic acid exporter family protein [Natronobacillus azotifigens]MCZ0702871.1 aromatic acid exporter family protein [Natronobacillus azotifigens]